MRKLFHILIAVAAVLGGLLLIGAAFGRMSAIQQAAIAALVSAWLILFHVVSSMLDRNAD